MGELLRASPEFECVQKLSDEAIASDVPLSRPLPLLQVAETEVEKAVREDIRPFLWLGDSCGVNVDPASGEHDGPPIRFDLATRG